MNAFLSILARSGVVICGCLVLALASGCATTECAMVCFAPEPHVNSSTGEELLTQFSSQVPFELHPRDFGWSKRSDEVIAWVVLDNSTKEHAVTSMLKHSADFRLLSVGYTPLKYRHLFDTGLSPAPSRL